MTIKLIEMKNIFDAKVQYSLDSATFDAVTKWRLVKFFKQLNNEVEIFEESRIALVKKYGNPEKSFQIDPENFPKFQNEYQTLASTHVEIMDVVLPLSQMTGVSIGVMTLMEPFISEEL